MEKFICDRCNGKGRIPSNVDGGRETCTKCFGDGELNWLERIFGKTPPVLRRLNGNWTIKTEKDLTDLYSVDLQSEIVDVISKKITEDIDKEILNELIEKGQTNYGKRIHVPEM
jgi:hypothetical protein